MSKQQTILIALAVFVVLVLAGFAGYASFRNRTVQVSDNDAATLAVAQLKSLICSNPGKPLDVNVLSEKLKIAGSAFVGKLTSSERYTLNGYYFCDGLAGSRIDEACGNGIIDANATGQCRNGFLFSEMTLASLAGDKAKAETLCKSYLGDSELCTYIGSFDEVKKNDLCAKAPEGEQPSCYAFFNGDNSRCKGTEQESDCFASAAFMKTVAGGDAGKCGSLTSIDAINNYDTVCRLHFDMSQGSCMGKYTGFTQEFCGASK
ncbi:MAG: hypothetical protein WCJ25_04135 [Candidatus Moraniibacteriota bacterium]